MFSRGLSASSAPPTTMISFASTQFNTRALTASVKRTESSCSCTPPRSGLFEMDWLLICAYCPQVAGSFRELDQVHPRFQCAFCNALNDVALDDYIQVAFTVSSGVRDIVFRHPETLSVEDYYLRYNFSKGFKPPHGMTHEQLVAALSRGFADIEAQQQQKLRLRGDGRPFRGAGSEPQAPSGLLRGRGAGRTAKDAGPARVGPLRGAGPADGAERHGARRRTLLVSADGRSQPGQAHHRRSRTARAIAAASGSSNTPSGSSLIVVEYEPFLSGKRLLLTPSFGELYKTQLVDEAREPDGLRHDLPVHRSEGIDAAV